MLEPITVCRACGSKDLNEFLDLGEQYLSDFREDDTKTPKYPLVAVLCEACKLVQLQHTTPQSEMYHERYGFKSGISESIKKDLDDIVTHAFQYKSDPHSWLDIASNDGTLLSFVPADIYRVGVDPIGFLCKEAEQHADKIVNNFFKSDIGLDDKLFDVITSVSCFYDMPDPTQFVKDVRAVLADNGVWVIQQNYLLTTMELNAVDNFCHEHIEYYTLLSLENLLSKCGLEVNEVYTSMVNGGSIRTIVSRKGAFPVDSSVLDQRAKEMFAGVQGIDAYRKFAKEVQIELDNLKSVLTGLKEAGKSICILAASTRGATIWQSAGIDGKLVDYAVERNPAKVGTKFTAIDIPIISEEEFRTRRPDYAVVGPWFFREQFVEREKEYMAAGGHLVMPLPVVEIIGA